uniref:4-coumarate--CoA ligase n=1 Tax=Ananas comosus var. bracteatus TaxID=296719 RepID=A0A6V7QTY1_ANACO
MSAFKYPNLPLIRSFSYSCARAHPRPRPRPRPRGVSSPPRPSPRVSSDPPISSSPLLLARSRCLRGICGVVIVDARFVFAESIVPSAHTFMEVAKEALRHASANHERAAIISDQKSCSYAQIVASALDISNILSNKWIENMRHSCEAGNSPVEDINGKSSLHGTRVGIVAKPSPEFVAGILGTWLSGGVAVPLALSYPEAELLHVMNDSDISIILSTQEHQEVMENVAAKCSARLSLLPAVTSMTPKKDPDELSETKLTTSTSALVAKLDESRKAAGDDPALILYTSGTTGKPKGVVHTHRSIISQVQILTEAWEYTIADQFLHCLPLHHIHHDFVLFRN